MELDIFQANAKFELHPKYRQLISLHQLHEERAILKSWTEGFIDRDNKIIHEFQTKFHSAFWEFFLFKIFKDQGFDVDFSKDRPDFIINAPTKFFVEAVTSNISQTGRVESSRGSFDILSMIEPPWLQKDFNSHMIEAIIRNSNALSSKAIKLPSYLQCSWVTDDDPFIIALGSFNQVNYGREFYFPLLALLYGWYFDVASRDYKIKKSILKPGSNSEIKTALFEDEKFADVSAVLFSCTVTLGKLTALSISAGTTNLNEVYLIREFEKKPTYRMEQITPDNPESLYDGIFIFHNPNAKNKLPKSVFDKSGVVQITSENGHLDFSGKCRPVYSRLNLPSAMLGKHLRELLIEETDIRFNHL